MAKVVTPPASVTANGFKVFLAGAIDMGNAVDWQSQAIRLMRSEPNLVLLNPRRADFTQDKLDEQIIWELDALEYADVIVMWFPVGTEAPVSFLELGLYLRSGKLILGVENGFYRSRNLELTAEYYELPVHRTLEALVTETIHRYKLAQSDTRKA